MRSIVRFIVCAAAVVSLLAASHAEGPAGVSASVSASEQVGRWGLWECVLHARGSSANPFVDVRVTASFVSPSGQRWEREAFFDGQDVWRVRIAPDAVGKWQWSVRSSPEDAGLTAGGTFECVESSLPGPLRTYAANPLWFAYADGKPVYVLAFHLWCAELLDEKTLAATLDFLAPQGFNAIVGPHLARDRMVWACTEDGEPDFSRFDLGVWRNLDRLLRMTGQRQMVVIPFSIFGGTNRLPAPRNPAARDMLLRYWVARWGGFWNATYQPISEWEEGYSEAEVLALGSRLRELDGGQHLISLHSQTAGSEAVQRAAWYDYHTVQAKLGSRTGQDQKKKGNDDPLKFVSLVEMHRKVAKPILAQECLWEGNFYSGLPGLDVNLFRRGAWVAALCGGQINYADEVTEPRGVRPQNALTVAIFSRLGMAIQPRGHLYPALRHLAGFMRAIPFDRMTPRPELVSTRVCLAEVGRAYAVYAPYGGEVQVDLEAASGAFRTCWFDPRTGLRRNGAGVDGGRRVTLSSPDNDDWVLLIESSRRPER